MPPVARRLRVALAADDALSVDSHPLASTATAQLVMLTAVSSTAAPAPRVKTTGPHSLGPLRNGHAASAGRRSRAAGGIGSCHSSRRSSGVKGLCYADDSGESPGAGFDSKAGIAREQTPISSGTAAGRLILGSGHVSSPDKSTAGPASLEHGDAVAGGDPTSERSLGNSGLSARVPDPIVEFEGSSPCYPVRQQRMIL
jgi:hypothetical protein